jgi:hypothetical protein
MQLEVIDKFGRVRSLRRGERLADGERIRVPHAFMDAASREARDALESKHGRRAIVDHQERGFRRGYQTIDATPARAAHDAAAEAYEDRSRRLENAWRKNHRDDAARAPLSTQDAAQARVLADSAYEDKKQRLQNAWRNR